MSKLSGRYKTSERVADTLAARYLAEAGVGRAIWEMNYGNISNWNGTQAQKTMTISNFTASNGSVIGNISITVYNTLSDNPLIESIDNRFCSSDRPPRPDASRPSSDNPLIFEHMWINGS